MMGNESIGTEKDKPERMKSLKIRGGSVGRDNGIKKVGRWCSRGRTTAMRERKDVYEQ